MLISDLYFLFCKFPVTILCSLLFFVFSYRLIGVLSISPITNEFEYFKNIFISDLCSFFQELLVLILCSFLFAFRFFFLLIYSSLYIKESSLSSVIRVAELFCLLFDFMCMFCCADFKTFSCS